MFHTWVGFFKLNHQLEEVSLNPTPGQLGNPYRTSLGIAVSTVQRVAYVAFASRIGGMELSALGPIYRAMAAMEFGHLEGVPQPDC